MDAHTTSSTSPANSRQVDSGAAGTAMAICAGSLSRRACTAASMLAPVASPSSTRITVLPVTSTGGLARVESAAATIERPTRLGCKRLERREAAQDESVERVDAAGEDPVG